MKVKFQDVEKSALTPVRDIRGKLRADKAFERLGPNMNQNDKTFRAELMKKHQISAGSLPLQTPQLFQFGPAL